MAGQSQDAQPSPRSARAVPDAEPPSSSDTASDPDGTIPPQTTPQTTPAPGGIAGIAGRARTFSRNAPYRESWITIDLGGKYVKAVIGGFQQGAVLGMGLQVTTADLLHVVEFRATALTSPLLYRRFEGEAYVPRIFDKNTHADVWFDYLRRTKDDFFGIGPRFPKTEHTNFDVEQRSYNASLFHDFAPHGQFGGYFSLADSGTFRGQRTRRYR